MFGQSNTNTIATYTKIENEDITVTQNGVYEAGEEYTGLGTVTVQVSGGEINNQNKTATVDGTYSADAGYTGLGQVVVTAGSAMASDIEAQLHQINSGTSQDESGDESNYEDPPL